MRHDWPIKELGDICRVIGGATPSKNREYFYKGIIPWATVRDMRHDIISETEFMITEDAVRSCSTNIIPANNVVIATRVGLGKICYIARDTAINQDLRGVIPIKQKELSTRFLFWWFKSIAHLIEQEGTGATVQGVKLPFIKSLRIPVPPLPEQKRIVVILDEAFEGIGTAVANAEKNVANAKHLFENYLQNIFSGQGDGWKNTTLGAVCELQNGFAFKSELFKPDGMPVLRISSIQNGEVCENRPVFASLSDYREDLSKYIVYDGDLLIAMSGATTGKVGFNKTGKEFLLNQRVGKFRPGRELDIFYLYYLLHTKVEDHLAMSAGSAQPNLSTKQIKDLIIPLPTMLDQAQIVEKITTLDDNVAKLKAVYEQKIAALSTLRQAILRKVFAGELITQSAEAGLEGAE